MNVKETPRRPLERWMLTDVNRYEAEWTCCACVKMKKKHGWIDRRIQTTQKRNSQMDRPQKPENG